jgi:hypothetical protein
VSLEEYPPGGRSRRDPEFAEVATASSRMPYE